MTGLTHINFEAAPFNELAYWFPNSPKLYSVDQDLTISVRTETGHIQAFKYRFSERNLFNPQASFDTRLQLHAPRFIEKETLKRIIEKDFPLLSVVHGQDLFFKQCLDGFSNYALDSQYPI